MKYFITIILLLILANPVFAVCRKDFESSSINCSYPDAENCNNASGCYWVPSSNNTGGTVTLNNPIETESPQVLIGNIINAVLGISGSLALVMFIYGGFTWMLSGGNSEKVAKGKNTLVWAAIGLIVIFSSYAMVNFVFEGLARSAGG